MSTIEAMKVRKSARLSDEQAEPQDEIPEEPKAKKNRSDKKITNIATLDNGTMVEAFKHLNYIQLAKSSLVSKRFWNLIRTNRHRLALLYVDNISMRSNPGYAFWSPAFVKVFNNVLSLEDYNKWVVGNQYSKQILLEDPYHRQSHSRASSDSESSSNDLESSSSDSESSNSSSESNRSDSESNNSDSDDSTSSFVAFGELNQENWPLLQHFVRLLTDPFIYIRDVELISEINVLNGLTGAIYPDRNRLQCEQLVLNLHTKIQKGNVEKFMSWIKCHMRCNKIEIDGKFKTSNESMSFLDFFATGSHCTSAIETSYAATANLSKVISDSVQKFMDLENSDEFQMVASIHGSVSKRTVDVFKRDYAEFIVKEETYHVCSDQVFEFVNNDVKKKLELNFSTWRTSWSDYSLKIQNL